ncbi:MAG TPA: porin [Stellaceae bacterium]|nr:porin [Stellaceae bacterium]
MPTTARIPGWLLGSVATLALICALAPIAAVAQSAQPDDRIDAIEHQIRGMEAELRQLKTELRQSRAEAARSRAALHQARAAAARAAVSESQAVAAAQQAQAVAAAPLPPRLVAPPPVKPAAVAPAPGMPVPGGVAAVAVQTSGNRFGLESADGSNSIFLTGRLHFDVGDYLNYRPASKFASVQDLNSGLNARRARLGVTGKFLGDWQYTLIYDFGGSTDEGPGGAGTTSGGIQTAELTYNGFYKGPTPVAFDLGYMDTPFTLDEATSSNDLMFMERASIQTVASGIFANDFRSAVGARSNNDRYWAGTYLTGPQSGATHNTGEQYGAFGRGTYQVLVGPDYSVHVGADVGALLKPPTVTGVQTITLSDRPELRIDPTTILSTGALGTPAHPVSGAQVYGVEGAAGWRNLFLQGEYYHIAVDRFGLATNGFDGGYIEGSWTITGEHRKYIPATGAYSGIVPFEPFEPWAQNYGIGAWELAFRYSTIDLNSNFTAGAAPGPTSNAVGGGTQTVYAVGLNWYLDANVRFMLDYLHANIDKRYSVAAGGGVAGTPLGTSVGGTMDALAMRMQFAF